MMPASRGPVPVPDPGGDGAPVDDAFHVVMREKGWDGGRTARCMAASLLWAGNDALKAASSEG